MTQLQHYYKSQRKIADINNTFMDMVKNGLSKKELQMNINRRPELWGRFSNWLDKLKN